MKLLTLLAFFSVLQIAILSKPDESPGFFLKVTKNIPRIGRRSDPGLISIPPSKRFNYYVSEIFIESMQIKVWLFSFREKTDSVLGSETSSNRQMS